MSCTHESGSDERPLHLQWILSDYFQASDTLPKFGDSTNAKGKDLIGNEYSMCSLSWWGKIIIN
jgi:hypothetical protein